MSRAENILCAGSGDKKVFSGGFYVRCRTYMPQTMAQPESSALSAAEAFMKTAIIFSLPMVTSEGICWRWRSVDGKTDSTQSFADYNECLGNAMINGYYGKITPRAGNGDGPGKQYGATRR